MRRGEPKPLLPSGRDFSLMSCEWVQRTRNNGLGGLE